MADFFQAQTPIGAGLQDLSKVFLGGASPLKRAALQSGIDLNTARMAKIRGEIQAQEREAKAPGIMADAVGRLQGAAPFAADPRQAQGFDAVQSMGVESLAPMPADQRVLAEMPAITRALGGGAQTGQIAGIINMLMANMPKTSDEAKMGALLGTGKTLGVNDAVSIAGQDRVRADNAANSEAEELAKIRATPLTEAQARGAAFSRLPSPAQAAATGPTFDESKGHLVISNPEFFSQLPGMDPAQQEFFGAQPTQQTPRNWRTDDGRGGVTVDNMTDSVTGEPLPAGWQAFTAQVQPSSPGGLTTGNRTKVNETLTSLSVYETFSDKMRETLAANPSASGVRGNLARITEGLLGQAADLAGTDSGVAQALQGVQDTLAGKGVDANGQPINADVQGPAAIARLLPFIAASAVTGQSGRDLSNEDRQLVAAAIGSPEDWLATNDRVLKRLDTIDELVEELAKKYQGAMDTGQPPPVGGAAPPPAADDFQAYYDALSSGATYTAPDGSTRKKP